MTRKEEFEKVKQIIIDKSALYNCGLFNCRNTAGDEMKVLFDGKHFRLECCENWAYFEIFGTNEDEWCELNYLYATASDNPFYVVIEQNAEVK